MKIDTASFAGPMDPARPFLYEVMVGTGVGLTAGAAFAVSLAVTAAYETVVESGSWAAFTSGSAKLALVVAIIAVPAGAVLGLLLSFLQHPIVRLSAPVAYPLGALATVAVAAIPLVPIGLQLGTPYLIELALITVGAALTHTRLVRHR